MGFGKSMAVPTLAVTNLETAREFYGKTLGLQERDDLKYEGGTTYEIGDSYLCLYERPTASGSTATSVAFAVDDFDETIKDLKSRGVKFEDYDLPDMGIQTKDGVAEMEGTLTAWFKDPFGNIVAVDDSLDELSHHKPPSQRASEEDAVYA